MLVGVQFNALLLDTRGSTISCYIIEFSVSVEHHTSTCCQVATKSYQRRGTSTKSGSSGRRTVATVGHHQYTEHDPGTVASYGMGICHMVVYNALFDIVSRRFYCNNLLFPEWRGE